MIGLHLHQIAHRLQVGHQVAATVEAVLPLIRPSLSIHGRVVVHGIDHRQTVSDPDLIVHRIVGWRDLDRPRAEARVHHLIGDDWDQPVDDGEAHLAAHHVAVARV